MLSQSMTYSARLLSQSSELGPPTPSPADECVPHFASAFRGEALAGEGGGSQTPNSQFGRGGRHCGTLGMYVLCEL
jgi:hypothetical protein